MRIVLLSSCVLSLYLTGICLADSASADSSSFHMDMRNVSATSADSASFSCTPITDANDFSPSFQVDLRGVGAASDSSAQFHSDAAVDVQDLIALAFQWLADDCQSSGRCAPADLNFDGRIDFADFALFASRWMQGI